MGRIDVIEHWKSYWQNEEHLVDKHIKVSPIFTEIKKILTDLKGKSILECGSGISEISIDITRDGANVFLLDISLEALKISKTFFNKKKLKATHVCASLFNIPFKNETFDIVWNAGVLEHYKLNDQISGLKEMSRVCKKGGIIITFNPYKKAFFYRLGKFFAEKSGKWEFGEEYPVESFKFHAEQLNLSLIKEYSFNFEQQITFLRYINKFIFLAIKFLFKITPNLIKPFWKKLFNGYLLVSIFKKT